MMTTGDRIHYLRTQQGFTLQELGDRVGVGASTVRKWETGSIKTLRTDKMQKLSQALDTTVDYLMGWTDNSVNVGTVGTNNGVIGQNSGEIHLEQQRSKEEAELLRIFAGAGESCVEHAGLYCRQVCVLELTVCATYIKVNQHSVVVKVNL